MFDTVTIICSICGGEVEIPDDTDYGEIYECPTCGAELEVVEIDPIEVQLVSEIEK